MALLPMLNSRSHLQYTQQTSSNRGNYSSPPHQLETQYVSQRGGGSEFSKNSDGSERRSSYSSTMSIDSHSTVTRGLPPVSDTQGAYQEDLLDRSNRDQYLPPIYGSTEGPNRGDRVSPHSLPTNYTSYGGSHVPDRPYSMTQYLERDPFNNGNAITSYSPNYEPSGDYGDSKHKRRRGNLPKNVTDTLRAWFTDHVAHPYPTEEEKQMLMARTGLTMSQVSLNLPKI